MDSRELTASKCHDIQVTLGLKEVPEFELLPQIGMMVNLSLHIRGLPPLEYDKAKLVSSYYFNIPSSSFKQIITSLADIEFVKLHSKGETIKSIIPQVPYFENIYEKIGEYAEVKNGFNEPEQLALKMLTRLSDSPSEKSSLFTSLGAEQKALKRNLQIGEEGGYLVSKRARGKDIILSPLFFSENADLFSDLVAKSGSKQIKRILDLIRKSQGWPLSLIEKDLSVNGEPITRDEFLLIKRLAQDGIVKPPSISTPHSGSNNFIFTPAPGKTKLNPSKREIYERAMALISAVRQGQLLANKYSIRNPVWILNALKSDGFLRQSTEAYAQYQTLAIMRVGRLIETKPGWHQFKLLDTEENIMALDLAISLLKTGNISNMEINEEARIALQKDQSYIESLVATKNLRESEKITISEEIKEEMDNLLLKGISND